MRIEEIFVILHRQYDYTLNYFHLKTFQMCCFSICIVDTGRCCTSIIKQVYSQNKPRCIQISFILVWLLSSSCVHHQAAQTGQTITSMGPPIISHSNPLMTGAQLQQQTGLSTAVQPSGGREKKILSVKNLLLIKLVTSFRFYHLKHATIFYIQ